jgi:hypothetical protein
MVYRAWFRGHLGGLVWFREMQWLAGGMQVVVHSENSLAGCNAGQMGGS